MKTATASSADIGEQHSTLNAAYWVSRQPGEGIREFRLRRETEDMERRAAAHEKAAASLREQARQLREKKQAPGNSGRPEQATGGTGYERPA